MLKNEEAVNLVIIILTLNQREVTIQCLGSLLLDVDSSTKVLVWDNGSTDGTHEVVRDKYPDVIVHHHPVNLGVASGRNSAADLAINMFDPHYLLFLDNDMLVEKGFISGLLTPLLQDERVGQTQAKLRFMHDRQRINDGGGAKISFWRWQISPVGFNEIDNGQYDQIKQCISCGGAMMVRTSVFDELGGFDTTFDPFGPEDIDFSLRLQKAGYIALFAPQAVAYHTVSHTFGKGYSEVYARHKSRHWFQFMRRHATIWQKMGFYCVGAPYLALRVIIREGKKGNIGALKGLVQGMADNINSSLPYKRNKEKHQ